MSQSSKPPLPVMPSKGERTRRRLFEAAVRRFQTDGYEAASLRRIASDAGVTPALLYRYFSSKEAIVTELYREALGEWTDRSSEMPAGTWTERTLWLTRLAFEVLAPYRVLLRVLASSMIAGDPTTSPILNEQSQRAAAVTFERAVVGATDAPAAREASSCIDLAYAGHLGLILFWVMDQTSERAATEELLEQMDMLGPLLKLGLKMPRVGNRLRALGPTIMAGFRGTSHD